MGKQGLITGPKFAQGKSLYMITYSTINENVDKFASRVELDKVAHKAPPHIVDLWCVPLNSEHHIALTKAKRNYVFQVTWNFRIGSEVFFVQNFTGE